MKNLIILISALLFGLVLSNRGFASEKSSLSHIKFIDTNGDATSISIYPYKNAQGTLEVRVDAASIPKFLNKFNPTIAYGRDLNGNGKIDTWFFISKNGIETVTKEGNDPFGRDVLGALLLSKYKTSPLLYLSSATTTMLSYLFVTASEYQSESKDFYLDWINLEELSIRLEQERKNPTSTLNYEQIQAQYALITYGFKQLTAKADRMLKKGIYEYMAIDVGLWVSGGIIVKWGGKLLSIPLKKLSQTSIAKYINENIFSFFKSQQEKLMNRMNFFRKKETPEIVVTTGIKLSAFTWRKDVSLSVRAYIIKKKLLANAKGAFEGAKSEWKYIALNIGIQTVAEAYTHYDDIKDQDPAVMTEKLLTNKDVEQDIGFMTLDTVLMTGVSRNLKTPRARFMACGLIALNDSSMINFVIKKDGDYKRIAFDTSWEVIVGNGQVQADLAALTFFEKMAVKNKNPKLKLLGYVFAIVDQGLGYVTYAKAAEKINNKESTTSTQTPILVPILTEE
jgi:hypothetical protein